MQEGKRKTNSRRTQDEKGCVEIWLTEDGAFGVSLLPDSSHSGVTFMSTEGPVGFPAEYEEEALFEWAEKWWRRTGTGSE